MISQYKKAAGTVIGLLLLTCLVLAEIRPDGLLAPLIESLGTHDLDTIPATFTGSMDVQDGHMQLSGLNSSLQRLAEEYGMSANLAQFDKKFANVQIYCNKNFVAVATTASDGGLVMFQTMRYGFRTSKDYKEFNEQLVGLMSRYGNVRNIKTTEPLPEKELLARGDHMKLDVLSKCGRVAVR